MLTSPLHERRLTFDLDRCDVLPGICLAGHYRNTDAREMLLEHRHGKAIEICYLARGRQVYRVGGADHALSAGDLFVTFPGEQHSTGGHPEEKGELFWIQIKPVAPRLLHLPPRLACALSQKLLSLSVRQLPASAEVKATFPEFFLLASRSFAERRDLLLRAHVASAGVRLVLAILEAASGARPASQRPSDMNSAIRFIAENLRRSPTVADVAAAVGLSESWFKSRFRRSVGIPPAEYILRERIEAARKMLQAGQKVTAVAMELGFSSSQYFATVFRRYTGKRPSEIS